MTNTDSYCITCEQMQGRCAAHPLPIETTIHITKIADFDVFGHAVNDCGSLCATYEQWWGTTHAAGGHRLDVGCTATLTRTEYAVDYRQPVSRWDVVAAPPAKAVVMRPAMTRDDAMKLIGEFTRARDAATRAGLVVIEAKADKYDDDNDPDPPKFGHRRDLAGAVTRAEEEAAKKNTVFTAAAEALIAALTGTAT